MIGICSRCNKEVRFAHNKKRLCQSCYNYLWLKSQPDCKERRKLINLKYNKKNRKINSERTKEWYAKNREKHIAYVQKMKERKKGERK